MKATPSPFECGLSIVPDFITPEHEAACLVEVDDMERAGFVCGRCVTRFGVNYLPPHQKLTGAPEVFFRGRCFTMSDHTAVTVNSYMPGADVSPHIDSHAFADVIYVLSLAGDCRMILIAPGSDRESVISLPRRSLVQMTGPVRHTWMHGIENIGERRVSVVYRKKLRHEPVENLSRSVKI